MEEDEQSPHTIASVYSFNTAHRSSTL